MTNLLSPGVYVEEFAETPQTIDAVSPSAVGILGFTPFGPSRVTRVSTLAEFGRLFGGLTTKSLTPYEVSAFFTNGGGRAYIRRITPADAVSATARLRSVTYDQRIETGATGTAAFSKTAGASVLKDNGGLSPLVPQTVTFRWRSAGYAVTSQIARTRDGSAPLVGANGVALYEGRADARATRLIPGATAPGGVYYRSVSDGNTAVEVCHVNAGVSQALSVTVSGNRITVNLATDSSAVVTSTATQVAAAFALVAAATALATATAAGDGSGLAAVGAVEPLRGMPATADAALDAIVPGTFVLTWTAGAASKTITFAATTSPVVTATNVAGSVATLDLRTGRFSLVCATAETPGGPDAGAIMSLDYTPATTTRSLVDDGAGAFQAGTLLSVPGTVGLATGAYDFTTVAPVQATRAIGAGPNGTVTITVDLPGVIGNGYTVTIVLPGGTSALSARLVGEAITLNLAVTSGTPTSGANTATLIATAIAALPGVSAVASGTGADEITAAAAAASFTGGVDDTRPHNIAAVLATYSIYARTVTAVSAGEWGNRTRLRVSGDSNYYTPATGAFGRYRVFVDRQDTATLAWSPVETYEELVFNDATSPSFWQDELADLSEVVLVAETGADEALGQLNGRARTHVIGGGDESTGGQTFSVTLPHGPVGARSVTIAYTDSDGTARTITDNGFGVLSGSVDASYAAVVGGLNPNRINLATGAINVRTALPVRRGTLVTVTYVSAPAADSHTETLGVASTGGAVGADGTFDATNYSRSQFTEPSLAATVGGVYGLDAIEEIMQVTIPDFAGDTLVSQDLCAYADARAAVSPGGGDRFIILTPPRGSTAEAAVDWVHNQLGVRTKYAAVYWPWIKVADPLRNNRLKVIPPTGHVAGIYARTDATRNVGKAPAGTVDGRLLYAADLERIPTQGDRDVVYPRFINPLRQDSQVGRCVWGAQTLAPTSVWRDVNAVRLFMFAERSVFNSTHWIVFENNGPALWARIKLQLEGFFANLFTDGYLAGRTRAEAYAVICDDSNNPQSSVDAGRVVVDVKLAPQKPAVFVTFRFSQLALST